MAPSSSDSGSSGNIIFDFYWVSISYFTCLTLTPKVLLVLTSVYFIVVDMIGHGIVSPNWEKLRHQSFHKLQIWYDVMGCSCCDILHQAGLHSNIVNISSCIVNCHVSVIVLFFVHPSNYD